MLAKGPRNAWRKTWWIVGLILGLTACGLNLISQDSELELGKQVSLQVESQLKVLKDAEVSGYIDAIGQKLAKNSRRSDLTYHIKVIDSGEVNAFALPGGYLYVNRGLIEAADNEAELAAVMGHEIAHVTERHATKQYTQAQLYQIASTVGTVVMGGAAGRAGQMVSGLGGALIFRKFSRMDEAEADQYGLEYMVKSGYDPRAAVTFFEKLIRMQKFKPSTLEALFATHPPTEDRIQEIKRQIKDLNVDSKDELRLSSDHFRTVKTRLRVKAQVRSKD